MEEIKKDYSKMDFRFSYVLSTNNTNDNTDIIFIKRDFNINNFNEKSLRSIELKECVDDIVNLIDADLKSKSRVYTWYNYDTNFVTDEFKEKISETEKTVLKFSFYDGEKPIITKIWSSDFYPCSVRSSVDLTNKKYKTNQQEQLDFVKQILKKASSDKEDLTYIIMKHLMTVCSSFYSKEYDKNVIFKQFLPEIMLEDIKYVYYKSNKLNDVLDGVFDNEITFDYTKYKTTPIDIIRDEKGRRIVCEAYTNNFKCGHDYDKSLMLTPFEKWVDDEDKNNGQKRRFFVNKSK